MVAIQRISRPASLNNNGYIVSKIGDLAYYDFILFQNHLFRGVLATYRDDNYHVPFYCQPDIDWRLKRRSGRAQQPRIADTQARAIEELL